MNKPKPKVGHLLTMLLAFCCFLLAACGKNESSGGDMKPVIPKADGKSTFENAGVLVDASHIDQGYMMVRYSGTSEKIFVQLIGPDQVEYKYFIEPSDQYVPITLTVGDGDYCLNVYESVGGEQYSPVLSQMLTLTLSSEFSPFLCPNQYVDYTMDSQTVVKGKELADTGEDGLSKVQAVYNWVVHNITYDYDKAVSVEPGYIPDIDETLKTGTGICFDYAAVMIAMLRGNGIPAKLNIGYLTEEIYHAWISVYLPETGWIDNLIEFDGKDWSMMDPTVASSSGSKEVVEMEAQDGNYSVRYVR